MYSRAFTVAAWPQNIEQSTGVVGLCDMYGDAFADLDQINQYFAGIATDSNYDLDQINNMNPIISDKNPHSGDTVHEYEVYKMNICYKENFTGC